VPIFDNLLKRARKGKTNSEEIREESQWHYAIVSFRRDYCGVRGDPAMRGEEVQPDPARHSPRDDWCGEDQPQRSRAIESPAVAFSENILVKF
jgi:hypothetical protein